MPTTTFSKRSPSLPDFVKRPGGGAEKWHDRNDVNIPVEGQNTSRTEVYWRTTCMRVATNTRGVYNWAWLDARFTEAIAAKQRVSLGFMDLYPEGTNEHGLVNYDSGWSSYPLWLHNEMKSNTNVAMRDWNKGGSWVPNYNNAIFHTWKLEFYKAIMSHIIEKGWAKVLGYVDIRYGSWGEWHFVNIVTSNLSEMPTGLRPTPASLKKIIDTHIEAFPLHPLVCPFAVFDCMRLGHTLVPVEVGDYLLEAKNNWGSIGWRRDNWGITDEYTVFYTKTNNYTYEGRSFKDRIMSRYKLAPIVGEPPGWNINYQYLESQVREYHATSFGNGNYAGANTNAANRDYIRAASKAAGYQIWLEKVETVINGKQMSVKSYWWNEGTTPPYWDWDIEFVLFKGTTEVKVFKSQFLMRGFSPAGTASIANDTFTFDGADGSYGFKVRVVDRNKYMEPMPLFVNVVAGVDGSLSLGELTLTGGTVPEPPVNQPPVCNAGPNRSILLPADVATLVGTASDPDGTIASIQWAQIIGPVTAVIITPQALTTNVRFAVAGTYEFRLTVTDNKGATSRDEVIVTVDPAVEPPPAARLVTRAVLSYDDGFQQVMKP